MKHYKNIPKEIKQRIIGIANIFEYEMKKEGFTIGKLEPKKNPLERFCPNGNYFIYVGYKAINEDRERNYIHCGSGCSLGLRYPVMGVNFLYFNKNDMRKSLIEDKEGILIGIMDSGRIELGCVNPNIKQIKEANNLYERIEKWIKQNGKKIKLEDYFNFNLYNSHLLK